VPQVNSISANTTPVAREQRNLISPTWANKSKGRYIRFAPQENTALVI
jgi:hypothetical protein